MATKNISIIGAGPNGFAIGIRLLQRGYNVKILEAAPQVGEGISARPKFNPLAIMHSGAFYNSDSQAVAAAFGTYSWLAGDAKNDPIHRIYSDNSFVTGKLVIARTEAGVGTLRQLQTNLRGSPIRNKFLTDSGQIRELDEPIIGEAGTLKAVLELPDVRAIDIKGYLSSLRDYYEQLGGEVEYSAQVTDFIFTNRSGDKIGLVINDGETQYSDAVINVAGIHAPALAQKSAEAAQKRAIPAAPTPEMEYHSYGVLVRTRDYVNQPLSKRVVYVAENANLPSVGMHSYLGDPVGDGRFTVTLGSFYYKTSLEQVLTRQIPSEEITPDMIRTTRNVFPDFQPEDYRQIYIGHIIRHQDRDFRKTTITHGDAVLVNAYISDSPGLTTTPINSIGIASFVERYLGEQSLRVRNGR